MDESNGHEKAWPESAEARDGVRGGGPGVSGGSDGGDDDPFRIIGHITPRAARGVKGFVMKSGYGVIDVVGMGGVSPGEKDDRPKRGEVSAWSRRSRSRLRRNVEAINWDEVPRLHHIVLTWANELPADGAEAHRQVEAFWKRWHREFGVRFAGVWKVEFQKRGAIHYSMWGSGPEGVDTMELWAWVRKAWTDIAGGDSEWHELYGARVQPWAGSPGIYMQKELFGGGKEYQNIAPEGYHVGRWWGFVGGLKPVWDDLELSFEQGVKVRRMVRRYLRSKGYRGKLYSDVQGVWACMLPQTRERIVEWAIKDVDN